MAVFEKSPVYVVLTTKSAIFHICYYIVFCNVLGTLFCFLLWADTSVKTYKNTRTTFEGTWIIVECKISEKYNFLYNTIKLHPL